MSVGSFVQSASSLLTGNPKKAKLVIVDRPSSDSLLGGGLNAVSGAINALSSATPLGSAISGLVSRSLEVHYNPSSISISANAQPTTVSYLLKNVDEGVPRQQSRPPSLTLSVDLIFDDMNIKDAFMAEKFDLLTLSESAGGLISTGATIARSILGKNYSVQSQTNGIVALLMRKETRFVSFEWANFSFSGEVNQVQAKYTMFSTSGRPVRSMVTLVLIQTFDTISDRDKWNQAFDAKFKSSLQEAGNRSVGQKVGNLLNISGF